MNEREKFAENYNGAPMSLEELAERAMSELRDSSSDFVVLDADLFLRAAARFEHTLFRIGVELG